MVNFINPTRVVVIANIQFIHQQKIFHLYGILFFHEPHTNFDTQYKEQIYKFLLIIIYSGECVKKIWIKFFTGEVLHMEFRI